MRYNIILLGQLQTSKSITRAWRVCRQYYKPSPSCIIFSSLIIMTQYIINISYSLFFVESCHTPWRTPQSASDRVRRNYSLRGAEHEYPIDDIKYRTFSIKYQLRAVSRKNIVQHHQGRLCVGYDYYVSFIELK